MDGYGVLTEAERRQALSEINKFARFSLSANANFSSGSPEFSGLSLACTKAIFELSAFAPTNECEPVKHLDRPFRKAPIQGLHEIFVLDCVDKHCTADKIWLSFLLKYLGGEGAGAEDMPNLSKLKVELEDALRLINECDFAVDLVRKNTGLIVPFPSRFPESGSGTSKILPGCLMLPSGAPTPILAECWLHECMHTELYLGEWLTGQELATSDHPVRSPWRTTTRSANLLLHGCFVFVNVAKFIRMFEKHYISIAGSWHLSAAKGEIISVSDVENVCNFRIRQVKEALQILKTEAKFSAFGRMVYERVRVDASGL